MTAGLQRLERVVARFQQRLELIAGSMLLHDRRHHRKSAGRYR
jgi:hypothetical protein